MASPVLKWWHWIMSGGEPAVILQEAEVVLLIDTTTGDTLIETDSSVELRET